MSSLEPDSEGLEFIFGMFILRVLLAMSAILTGIQKFSGTGTQTVLSEINGKPNDYGLTETLTQKTYSLSNNQGLPSALYDRLKLEPLVPNWALNFYDTLIGPFLIIVGVTLLLGIATRLSLLALGLVHMILIMGLILIGYDAGIASAGVHIIMIVMALTLINYNRFTLVKNL